MRALLIVTLLSACAMPLPPVSAPCHAVAASPRYDELDGLSFLEGCWVDPEVDFSICWRREPGRWVGEMPTAGALVIAENRGELELMGWAVFDPPVRTLSAGRVGRDEIAFGASEFPVDFAYDRRNDHLQMLWWLVLQPGREPEWVVLHRVPSGSRLVAVR